MGIESILTGVAAPLIGGLLGSSDASKAADAQENASNKADATQRYEYDTTRADNQPFHDAGVSALGSLTNGLLPGGQFSRRFSASDLNADPVYQNGLQFGLNEGTKAINRSGNAAGSYYSPATAKALMRFGNDYATTKGADAYNRFNTDETNMFNRYAGIAGVGQQANSLVANAGQNAANNISQNQIGAGNARASGYIAQGNAINGALGQGLNQYQNQQYMNILGGNNTNSATSNTNFDPNYYKKQGFATE